MKYREWLAEWLEYYVKPTVKARTYEKYKRQATLYLSPCLGEYEIENLTPLYLQKFAASITESGLSPNTVNGIITSLQLSLRCAVQAGNAEHEYGKSVVRPKIREKKTECFSKEEQKKMEEYILKSNNMKLLGVVIALYTGLRIGELLALRWEDIDIRKGLISVRQSCSDGWSEGKYKKFLDMPKTESSIRIVPLPQQLLPHIKELKKTNKQRIYHPRQYGLRSRDPLLPTHVRGCVETAWHSSQGISCFAAYVCDAGTGSGNGHKDAFGDIGTQKSRDNAQTLCTFLYRA